MSLDSHLFLTKKDSGDAVLKLAEIPSSPLIHNWFLEYIDANGNITFQQVRDMHKVCTEVLNTTVQRQETATNVRYVYGKGHHVTEYTCPFVFDVTYPTFETLELCKKIFPNEHIDSAKANYHYEFFCSLQHLKFAFEMIFHLMKTNYDMEDAYNIYYENL